MDLTLYNTAALAAVSGIIVWALKLVINLAGAFREFKAVVEERHQNTTKTINGIKDAQKSDAVGIHARLTEVRDELRAGTTAIQRRIDAAFRN